jgi:hypothetical protein
MTTHRARCRSGPHGQRLLLVVGDEDRRDAYLALDALQFDLHVHAQRLVERRKGLVQKQHRGLGHDGAGQRHALALPARTAGAAAVRQGRQAARVPSALNFAADLRSRHTAHATGRSPHCPPRSCWETGRSSERPCRCALLHRHASRRLARRSDVPPVGEIEPRDHPQERGLAAAGGSQQREEPAILEADRHVVERLQQCRSAWSRYHARPGHQRSPPNRAYRAARSIRPSRPR